MDKYRNTILMYVSLKYNKDIIDLLKKYGAK
jgi:hypothetical protein